MANHRSDCITCRRSKNCA
ncbi:MAG: hypothetical protein IJC88_04835 [Oscillospiraceae bacterium]|nr:hypothetical protein [Oscillospiraceae bacterium]